MIVDALVVVTAPTLMMVVARRMVRWLSSVPSGFPHRTISSLSSRRARRLNGGDPWLPPPERRQLESVSKWERENPHSCPATSSHSYFKVMAANTQPLRASCEQPLPHSNYRGRFTVANLSRRHHQNFCAVRVILSTNSHSGYSLR